MIAAHHMIASKKTANIPSLNVANSVETTKTTNTRCLTPNVSGPFFMQASSSFKENYWNNFQASVKNERDIRLEKISVGSLPSG